MSAEQEIVDLIRDKFAPDHLQLLNESHMHSGPAVDSHFKLICVSKAFTGLTRVKRHQLVYALLVAQFEAGMHALALHLYSPEEWAAKASVPESPSCQGANKP